MRSGIYDPALSDHMLIYGIINEKVRLYPHKVITFRSYKTFDLTEYQNLLSTAPWHVGELFDDVDDQEYYWTTMMNDIANECCPIKKMRVRAREWKNAIRAKRRASVRYYRDKTAENWELKQKCRNEATRQRRIAIREFWKSKADDLKVNPKIFFQTFKPFLGGKNCNKNSEINLKVDDAIITEQNTVAEILVDYFATIADDIGGDMAKRHSIDDFIGHPSVSRITTEHFFNDETISIKPVTNSEVYNALHLLNTRKATGYDAIPAKLLQFGANELAKPLTNLYNFCIRNGKWPQNWKRGEWHPIFKSEDPQQKSNYRPITVLPAVDKVFEQLVGKQLTKQTDHLLNHCITAYRKSHSCETTLVCLIENWKLAKDNHRNVAIYYQLI
jgi:hypothetical protein